MEEVPIGEPRPTRHPLIRRALSIFLAGLATVIPILGTVWLIYLIFKVLFVVGEKIIDAVLVVLNFLRGDEGERMPWKFEFPGDEFAWFFIPVTLLFLMGFAVMNRPGRAAVNWTDGAITRIPVLGFIYAALKQFVDALRNLGGPRKFKGVAYVEYPSPGCRLLGFVTGNYHDPLTGKEVTTVFIPTSPNPMTGFVVVVDDDKLIDCPMTLEEASKMILSAGLVSPASYMMGKAEGE